MKVQRIIRKLGCLALQFRLHYEGGRGDAARTIYLTFDDGPHDVYTTMILDLLKLHGVRATFFINGSKLEKNRDLGVRMVGEGHVLGNHTYSHRSLLGMVKGDFESEILRCQRIIDEYQDRRIRLFRPPQGLLTLNDLLMLRRHKLRPVMWTINSNDCFIVEDTEIIDRLKSIVSGNCVILFHDDSILCIKALRNLIPYWISRGFGFEVVPAAYKHAASSN